MSRTTFRLNMTASSFPLVSSNYGASVAGRGRFDTDYVVTNQYSGSQADAFIGIPSFLYLHNCLPFTHGMQSVGFAQVAPGLPGAKDFDSAFQLQFGTDPSIIFVPAKGINYVKAPNNNWQSAPTPMRMAGMVTTAYLKGKSYICYQGNGIFTYNKVTGQIVPVTLGGLNSSSLLGITAANSYLVAFDSDTVYFSNPTDELDFQPTLASGAGSESILQAKGKIICCLPIENGFIVYTTRNAVSASFSGDSKFPWIYREIDGSSGINSHEHVAHTSNFAGHYAFTSAGMQLVGIQESQSIFPEVTDFLLGAELEDYVGELGLQPGNAAPELNASVYGEFATAQFGQNQLMIQRLPPGTNGMLVKIAIVASRYLVISHGIQELTHMLVYDTALRRWGKLRKKHVAVFEHSTEAAKIPGNTRIAILERSGRVNIVSPVSYPGVIDKSDSVLFLGRIQAQRGQNGELLAVDSSRMSLTDSKLSVLASLNGNSWQPEVTPMLTHGDPEAQRHQLTAFGKSFVLKYTGDFKLSSVEVDVNVTRGG